jgi:hypothetical protein
MKKLIILIAGIAVVGALAWFAYKMVSGRGRSNQETEMWDFAIKDTASIDRIVITESGGAKIDIVRNAGGWSKKDGGCVQQIPVFNMLEAAVNIRLKGYVPQASLKRVTAKMASSATEVQFYRNGEWYKTWHVGYSTADHYGTYMLLNSEEHGQSDRPVIMEMKGLNGILTPRFFADRRKWACTEVFALEGKEIAYVDVKHLDRPERSFTVNRQGKGFSVVAAGRPLAKLDTSMVTRYLNNYRKVHFEFVNSDLTQKQVDSLKRSTPFCVLTVRTVKGQTTKLRMFRRALDAELEENVNMYGEPVDYDVNRFWCELPGGEVVKCQYFVFDRLIRGDIYFNYQIPLPASAKKSA